MPYYDFYRHYSVKANSPKEAKVKFSRALENHEEDQYYVGTQTCFPPNSQNTKKSRSNFALKLLLRLVSLIGWFFKGAIEQFTYTAPKKPKRYRQYN